MPRASPLALAALAALALAGGCATPRGTADEPVITHLDLAGARGADRAALEAGLVTQPPACTLGLFCDYARLDPDALAVDRRRIEAFYRERGYYRVRTEAPQLTQDGAGRVRVRVPIDLGSPVRVSRIELSGLDTVAQEARPGKLPLQVGDVFTEAAYDATRAHLEAALHSHGYATGEVVQAARVLPEEGTAEVTYTVTPGPRYRFGRVFVAGTAAVSRDLLAAQAERELKPGEWYDDTKLARAQARVFELGAFAGVRVTRGTPDPERGTVPVVVSVREAPFRSLRFGPGIGFQATRWEGDGLATWTHRNFLGDLRKVQLEAKAGYAWLPNPIKPARQDAVGQLAAEFSQPAVIAHAVDLSARIELERSLEAAYGFWSERLRLGAPLRLAPRWTVAPSYNLEVYQLHAVVGDAAALPQFSNCPSHVCLVSYLEQRLAWDGRDDPINTHRGLYASLSVQEGFHVLGAGYTYLRVLPEARFYLRLGRAVLAGRGRVGILVPVRESGAAPVVALFTSGGAQNMRGYGAGRLSPMVLQDGRWVPTGGNGLLDGTLELRVPLAGSLGGALFLDGGNVSPASGDPAGYRAALDPTRLQLAAGLGIRYRTPFGPLRVDLAGRLPTDWSAGTALPHRFPAVPGDSDHREPLLGLNITLGEAF